MLRALGNIQRLPTYTYSPETRRRNRYTNSTKNIRRRTTKNNARKPAENPRANRQVKNTTLTATIFSRQYLSEKSTKITKGGEKTKTKIIVPLENDNGLNAQLAQHFGRAPFYAVVSLDEKGDITSIETVRNEGEHFGGAGHMHDHILKLKPNAIITHGLGPRGLNSFQSMGIAVLKANSDTLKEVIDAYKSDVLQEITEGCLHAHHH